MARRRTRWALAWVAAVAIAPGAGPEAADRAQERAPASPVVAWTLEAPDAASPATAFTATLRAVTEAGWKFYGATQTVEGPRPLRVRIEGTAFAIEGSPVAHPPPKTAHDATWSAPVSYHDGTATFAVTLRAAAGTTGNAPLRVKVRYQACSDELCLRPTEITLERPVTLR
jgi:hypothetical protein